MNKLLNIIVLLISILTATFGVWKYIDRFALAEDLRTLKQQTQQSDYCILKELVAVSVRNEIRDYNQNYGKDCARCDDKQKEDYGILLEEKERNKKLMEICK
jgi:hypothetical protein